MVRRVLVTRPEPGASRTAIVLRAKGHDPVVLPLTRIAALDPLPLACKDFDCVLITSANAVRQASDDVLKSLRDLSCLTVGNATAAEATKAGFTTVKSADGDVTSLLSLVEGMTEKPTRIAYLCGRMRRAALEEGLAQLAIETTPVETYLIQKVSYSTQELSDILANRPFDAVLVYSREAARALLEIMAHGTAQQPIENAIFICLSKRIGDAFYGHRKLSIAVADRPDEAALLECLEQAS